MSNDRLHTILGDLIHQGMTKSLLLELQELLLELERLRPSLKSGDHHV